MFLLVVPQCGLCGIYKYRDAEGRLNFVDDESKVPIQYRDQLTPVPEVSHSHIVYESEDGQESSAVSAPADLPGPGVQVVKK